jgi:hypothetical protein
MFHDASHGLLLKRAAGFDSDSMVRRVLPRLMERIQPKLASAVAIG